jgi:hypothetical protein
VTLWLIGLNEDKAEDEKLVISIFLLQKLDFVLYQHAFFLAPY